VCLIAQGGKQATLAGETYRYDPAHFLLVSVDLPVIAQVVEASTASPYLGLRIEFDPGQVGELLLEAKPPEALSSVPRRGLAVSPVDPPLLDAVTRLVGLLDSPRDIGVLAPLVLREITYRLILGEQGARLRQIAADEGQAQRIARAIRWLKTMSPLQYQKQLRLQEARRLMLSEALDAASAGYRVGYESPSQFSREYRRLFGQPPHSLEWPVPRRPIAPESRAC
jgi:hypothetical protein